MQINFQRKPKKIMTGVRLTEQEHREVAKLSKKHGVSLSETCSTLIRSALLEYKKPAKA